MPNVPIQTRKKQFVDSFGNTQDLTHTSALGPLREPSDDESHTGPRFRPVRFHQPVNTNGKDPRTMGPQPQPEQSGYSNPVDAPEWRRKYWGH
jgi:hypothetical protein